MYVSISHTDYKLPFGRDLGATPKAGAVRQGRDAFTAAIILGILGSVTITVFLMTALGYRTFFTPSVTLVDEATREA